MTHDEAEEFLAHYGKMGMKWGRRSNRTPSARSQSIDAARKQALAPNLLIGPKGNRLNRTKDDLKIRELKKSGASKAAIYEAKKTRDQNWVEANKLKGREVAGLVLVAAAGVTLASIYGS